MEPILFAEIYLICAAVLSLLLYWTMKGQMLSTQEQWLKRTLIAFLINAASDFLFTLFHSGLILSGEHLWLSYLLKSAYFVSLDAGVYMWCGYAESELRSSPVQLKMQEKLPLYFVMAVPVCFVIINLWTHQMFFFDEARHYTRSTLFHVNMVYLFVCSLICSVRMLKRTRPESDPIRVRHMYLTASFPLCILIGWLLTFIGEAVPVVCVSVMIELLCLYMGTTRLQVSMDRLTQVNNRQNLMGFMHYKLAHHDGNLYLLMIDLDDFKDINDNYGHLEGDNALVRTAQSLKRACAPLHQRPYIARYGGDEFIVIMEGTDQDTEQMKTDIRAALLQIEPENAPYHITLSIGIARYTAGMTPKDLIAAADAKLYEIKATHKTRR